MLVPRGMELTGARVNLGPSSFEGRSGGTNHMNGYTSLTIVTRHARIFAATVGDTLTQGAEGERDRVLALGLETLRQKDCCEQNLWRGLFTRPPKGQPVNE